MPESGYASDRGDLNVVLVGDCIVTRDLTRFREPRYLSLVHSVRSADVTIGNCEMLFHEYNGIPCWEHGGTHMAAEPRLARSLKWLGVSMVSTANNHSFDYGAEGVLETIANLDKYGIVHAGTGRHLTEASAPAYFDSPKGRIALIGVTATLPASNAYAADPRGVDRGRPGANVLRHHVKYTVPNTELDALRAISHGLGFEARKARLSRGRNPDLVPDSSSHFTFLNTNFDPYPSFAHANFELGDSFKVTTTPHAPDVNRNIRWIENARYFADWVVVSIHCHNSGAQVEAPPDFVKTFAHQAIDAGADIVHVHGPHHAYQGSRGIEIYRDRPILYGVGAFLDQMSIKWTPADGYERYGLLGDADATPADFQKTRSMAAAAASKNFVMEKPYSGETSAKGVGADHSAFLSLEWREGRCTTIKIHPITLDGQRPSHGTSGRPMLAPPKVAEDVVSRFQTMSSVYGTTVTRGQDTEKNCIGIVQLG